MNKNELKIKKWKEIRIIGKTNYIILHGVLLFGIATTAITSLTQLILFNIVLNDSFTLAHFIITLFSNLLIGLLIGTLNWNRGEKFIKDNNS